MVALQVQVPSLIHGIRNAGLLVGILGSADSMPPADQGYPVDAFLDNGNVVFMDPSSIL